MLELTAAIIDQFDPRNAGSVAAGGARGQTSLAELLASFREVDRRETDAVLHVVAAFVSSPELRSELQPTSSARSRGLPAWLDRLGEVTVDGARTMGHVLDDGEDLLLGVHIPPHHELTVVVYVDHNVGTLVKDAFVVAEPLDVVADRMHQLTIDDADTTFGTIDPADARAHRRGDRRGRADQAPLRERRVAELPTDRGVGDQEAARGRRGLRPPRSERRRDGRDRRRVPLVGRGPFRSRDEWTLRLLDAIVGFGAGHGTGDPLLWSPVVVEIFLADFAPSTVRGPRAVLEALPATLRAFVRFAMRVARHQHRVDR